MRHIMWRCFASWNYDKEEEWLNELSSRGLMLVSPGIVRYIFEEGTPGEYQYRLEYLERGLKHPESAEYIQFMEGSGAEHIGSVMNWAYFRKKTSDGPFELLSDIDSHIQHFRRIFRIVSSVMLLELFVAIYEVLLISMLPSFKIPYFGAAFFLLLFGFLLYGTIKLGLKIRSLKKERRIRE